LNLSYPSCEVACADALETTLQQEGDSIAAFIFEPIIGAAAGAVVPPLGYYERVRAICEERDVLLIADEVITAFGRTGSEFALDHFDIRADLITCAKGLSGGYTPLGAVLLDERVIDALTESGASRIFTGFTYSAHPVSCAAGLAVLRFIKAHDLIARARVEGDWLATELHKRLDSHPSVGDIRGKGLLVGIEFVRDKDSKMAFPVTTMFGRRIVARAWDRHMILRNDSGTVGGVAGDHLLLAPPLTVTREELTTMVDVLENCIAEVEAAEGMR
jgi:adenosylmethionine-8-amino-7-oxononanoate aminotransferase